MDDDTDPSRSTRPITRFLVLCLLLTPLGLMGTPGLFQSAETGAAGPEAGGTPDAEALSHLPPEVVAAVLALLLLSAFFSGSETAFFSIHKLRLRVMHEGGSLLGRRVAEMMKRPGRLLTTVLIGNMIVNVLIAIFLGTRVERAFQDIFHLQPSTSYPVAVAICTVVLVFFGEVMPKVLAVRAAERFARFAVFPLLGADRLLSPLRNGLLWFTNILFRVTHFHDLRAAPFITDDELKSVLSDSQAHGVIEEDERQMIQGILEFTDATLREILVPRPDVIAIPDDGTVGEALDMLRDHEYSRMPIYHEDLDHVTGLLVAKDLLPSFTKGDLGEPVRTLARPAHFVPETMTAQQFVRQAQRRRTHLAVVVDEYGGTRGIVTLEDAIEEVVGDIMDEDEQEAPLHEQIAPGVYRIDGSLPLDELSEVLGIDLEDEEHETVAGFLMNKSEKVPEPGDSIRHAGAEFTVEACNGRRASTVRIELLESPDPKGGEDAS